MCGESDVGAACGNPEIVCSVNAAPMCIGGKLAGSSKLFHHHKN